MGEMGLVWGWVIFTSFEDSGQQRERGEGLYLTRRTHGVGVHG